MNPEVFAATSFRRSLAKESLLLIALLFGSARAGAQTTYYWDNNGSTAGFGTASGTWAAPTVGGTTQGWSTSSSGTVVPGNVTTTTSDSLNFGTASGLATGTIALSGAVSGGNLTFGGGSGNVTLSGSLTLADATTITVNNPFTATITGIVGGAGTSLTKTGQGTLVLGSATFNSAASNYTGATYINNGTLILNAANNQTTLKPGSTVYLGDTSGSSNATLQIGNSNATTVFNGTIAVQSGNSGTSRIILKAFGPSNVAPGLTGTITLGSGTQAGRSVTLESQNNNTSAVVNSVIEDASGATSYGTVTFTGPATSRPIYYYGNATYQGATVISNTNTVLYVGNPSGNLTNTTAGRLGSGPITNNGQLFFARTDGYGGAYGNAISGSGSLTIRTGRLTLGAANTYTGATTISGGTLALGSAGSIASSGTVTVGSAGSTGAVLDLTAMASSYAFASGQRVQGIGTLDIGTGKTVSSAGIWAPGNSVGSNAVTGNLSLTGTSQFELGTPGTSTSSPGTSDFTAVSGTLTLGGNLSLIDNAGADGNGSAAGGVYRLFTYGSTVSGSYASVTTNPTPTTRTSLANITYGGSGTAAGQGVFLSVYNLAAGSVTSGTSINLGTVLKNTSLSQSLSISNTAPLGNFSEGLNASFGALSGGATTNSGSISLLPAGGTSTAMSVGLGSATAGAKNGSALVNFFSDGAGTSGLGATSVGSQTVSLTATVLDPAVASFTSGSIPSTSLTLTFGSVNEGESASQGFSLYSLLQTAGFTADLALVSIDETNPSGPFSTNLTQFNNLASGSFNSWQVFLDPAGQGTFSNTWTLQFKSANGGSVYTGDTPQTLTLMANVIIVPEPGAIALAGTGVVAAGWMFRRRQRSAGSH